MGGGSFRIEEYKKPEYEVTVDAPTKPVMLGEKITATIKAKYYFGSPVTKAKVKYKVNRTEYNERWYPVGHGIGSTARLLVVRLRLPLVSRLAALGLLPSDPVLVAAQQSAAGACGRSEVSIGPDGTVKVEIDTGAAKAIHPDQDQSYSITAEVIDESRRTSSARARFWSPESRSRSMPGSIAATIASAIRLRPISRPVRSTESRCKAAANSSCSRLAIRMANLWKRRSARGKSIPTRKA